jgi:hypothetical protein
MKAFYRRALAHEQLGNITKAKSDIRAALDLNPSDIHVKEAHDRIQSLVAAGPTATEVDGESTEALVSSSGKEEPVQKQEEEEKSPDPPKSIPSPTAQSPAVPVGTFPLSQVLLCFLTHLIHDHSRY